MQERTVIKDLNMIKALVKRFLHLLGFQLSRLPTAEQTKQLAEAEQRKTLWLRNMEVKTIIDIGANTGQFAKAIYQIFPKATIYAFEPLQDCYEELVSNFKDVMCFQAFNLALGNETGSVEMYRNEFSPSSSLLPMAELHKKNFPHTEKEFIYHVNTVRLDDIASELKIHKPLLVKVDVQGFEDRVIAGGMSIIKQADIIIIELSIEQLYEGQPLFDSIYQTLVKLGFQYRGNYDQLYSPNDGSVLQVDGIFINC